VDRIKVWWTERPLWQKIGLAVGALAVAIYPMALNVRHRKS
jgi:hypothetical protein